MDTPIATQLMPSDIWQIDRRWFVTRPSTEPEEKSTLSLSAFRCVVLLGAAGSGKTIEASLLAEHERATGKDVRECRLAEYAGSADELSCYLNELARNADDNTAFYLDALDEAMVPLRRAWLAIQYWINECLSGTGAAVRIICRSAVWPDQLATTMRAFSGGNAFCLAMLQPLNQADIATVAEAFGVDVDRFMAEVKSRRAEVLATQPLALRMLLRLYAESCGLPSTLRELFDAGIRELCTDRYERFEIGTDLQLSPDNLLAAAERVACYTILTGCETIDLGDEPASGGLSWTKLVALQDGSLPLDRDTLRAVGSSGLCDSVSPASFRFGHRQFAEYLAGQRLARLLPHQTRSLLASPAGWKAGVAGPLRETAAFVAMENPEIASWLAHYDPEVVGLSDVADPELRRTATLSLLDRFRQGEMTDAQVGRGEMELYGFQYANAEVDLRPVLRERGDHCEDVLECAISLIDSWSLISMSEDLADLVLDTAAPHHARVAAGYALIKFGSENARARLKPLITDAPNDEHDQIRGIALRCNWPDRLTVPELLEALTPRSYSSFHGAYDGFLWELEREGFDAEGYLVDGLRWAKSHFSALGDSDPAHRIAMRIVHASVRELDDPDVAKELVSLLQYCASNHIDSPLGPLRKSGFTPREDEPELAAPLESQEAIRRQLIDALAHATDTPKDLWWLAHCTPGLCVIDDFLWLLERSCDATQTLVVRESYLEIARWLPWMSRSDYIDAWLAVRDIEPVTTVLGYPTSIELESAEAARLREEWKQIKALEEPAEPKTLDQPPRERVLQVLSLSETKDARFFFNLCQEMTLEPTSTHYGFERFLTQSPGWKDADDETQSRIVESAKRFLTTEIEDPESCRDKPLNSILHGCMAAIWLILEIDSEWLQKHETDWWQRWCWYILRELRPNMHDEPEAPKEAILAMLCSAASASVRHELIRLASDTTSETKDLLSSLLQLMDNTLDPDLDDEFCRMLSEGAVRSACVATIAQFVLARQSEAAISVCVAMLESSGPDEDESPAVSAAVSLLFECPSEAWSAVAHFVAANEDYGRRVLAQFAHGSRLRNSADDSARPLDHLTPTQWGELVGLLLELFPPESDPQREGVYCAGSNDSARDLRDRLISALGDRDDQEGVNALRQLEQRYGARYPWLRRPRARAERSYRLSQWIPIPLDVIGDLLKSQEKRLIRSEDDVLNGIEVALEAYAQALRQDGAESVDDFWNTPKGEVPSPKAEGHVSRKLCGAIRSYFDEYAIAADREVEIHRRTVPKASGGESGSELDVLVQVPARGASCGTRLRIPLEIKLSCNDQAKTGMKDQLVDRYIRQLGATHGLYIVVWMSIPNEDTLRSSHKPKWASIDAARAELESQAETLSESEGVVVRSFVMDGALR